MKYLIPFWWVNERPSDIGMDEDWQAVVLMCILIAGVLMVLLPSIGAFITWQITMVGVRTFILGMLFALIPNYIVSYLYWRKAQNG